MTEPINVQPSLAPAQPDADMEALRGFDPQDVLSFMVRDGTIDIGDVADQMRKAQRQAILSSHPYKIFERPDRWYTHVHDPTRAENRRKITAKTRERLEDKLIEHYSQGLISNRDITLAELYPVWKKSEQTRLSERTISKIERLWKAYYSSSELIHIPIRKLTKNTMSEWAHTIVREHYMKKKEYYNCVGILKQALEYAEEEGIIDESPYKPIKINRNLLRPTVKPEDETQVYMKDELPRVRELAWKDYNNPRGNRRNMFAPLAVLFMFDTGVRIGEVLVIRHEDIISDGTKLRIHSTYDYEHKKIVRRAKGKDGERIEPLSKGAMEIIRVITERKKELGLPAKGYLFSEKNEPLPYHAIQYAFSHYCETLGLVHKSSHKARKTFISNLIEEGLNINTICQYVGHEDEKTTLNNYCFDRNSEDEKLKAFHAAMETTSPVT